jgi:hypothetical protein
MNKWHLAIAVAIAAVLSAVAIGWVARDDEPSPLEQISTELEAGLIEEIAVSPDCDWLRQAVGLGYAEAVDRMREVGC